jgi:hypothetical protein
LSGPKFKKIELSGHHPSGLAGLYSLGVVVSAVLWVLAPKNYALAHFRRVCSTFDRLETLQLQMRTIFENLQPNFPYRVRQLFAPGITRLARTLGQPEYRLRDSEYVGTVEQPLDEFTETLQTHGFEWDPLAWYH